MMLQSAASQPSLPSRSAAVAIHFQFALKLLFIVLQPLRKMLLPSQFNWIMVSEIKLSFGLNLTFSFPQIEFKGLITALFFPPYLHTLMQTWLGFT